MTANKKRYPKDVSKKNGKKGPNDQLQELKTTAKYTIERNAEDIKRLQKVKDLLNAEGESYVTDSSIYRDLPELYLYAIEKEKRLEQEIQELTAKEQEFDILKGAICRILDSVGVKHE